MIKIIKEVSKAELKDFLYHIDLSDENIYKELNTGNVFGIFQFDGGTANNLTKKIKPKNFEEMVAINSLARPGTIDFAEEYNENKETGKHKYPDKIHDLLSTTYGIILYQEQLMSIFNKIGNFSLEETNEVRSLMKKLSKADKKQSDVEKWQKTVERFIDEAIKNDISKKDAESIADDLLRMSGYSFNRSHAVAYSFLAAITLYLSYYFKPYFYSSTLTYEAEKQENLKRRIDDCKTTGYTILPPDINRSNIHFYPEGKNIRFGLNEIKFVGENPAATIVKNRPYTSIFNYIEKNMGEGITSKASISLIKAGAFDELINGQRKKYAFIFEQFAEKKKTTKVIEKLQSLWNSIEENANSVPGLETTENDLIEYEKEFFGFVIFNTLFSDKKIKLFVEMNKRGLCDLYFDELDKIKPVIRLPVNVESFRTLLDKNGNEMAFLNCSDISGTQKRIPVFQSYWKSVKDNFNGEGLYLISAYLNEGGDVFFGSRKWLDEAAKKRMLRKI